ncbi:MAG: DUF4416 family protein [Spirochaetales bacterium]|nr:DUF4416 family protein [Spirochaetales bacterium]
MGIIKPFPNAKLITGILISQNSFIESLYHNLIKHFGPVDYSSDQIPFTFSPYYNKELGTPIYRFFISFENLIDPAILASIKVITNRIEDIFREKEKRKINIDPGVMFLSRFILASTKASVQRIPLDSGIYGEITLVYEKKTFRPVEWTYPDYRTDEYIHILNKIREIYKQQLK